MLRVLIAGMLVGTEPAWACLCARVSQDAQFLSYGPRRHLPANAKGVLFRFLPPIGGLPLSTRDDGVVASYVDALPPGPDVSAFTVLDLTEKKTTKVFLKNLANLPQMPVDDSMFGPRKGFPVCRPERQPDASCRTAQQRFESGQLESLTSEAGRRYGIFRVEPVGGFKPGHEYRFEYAPTNSSLEVVIDDTMLGPLANSSVTFVSGVAATRQLPFAEVASCSTEASASVQDLRFWVGPALQKYRDSLLFFTERSDQAGFRGYLPHLCVPPQWGRSALGLGEELVYLRCDDGGPRALSWEARGTWAFLEVEAVAHVSATLRGKLHCE